MWFKLPEAQFFVLGTRKLGLPFSRVATRALMDVEDQGLSCNQLKTTMEGLFHCQCLA